VQARTANPARGGADVTESDEAKRRRIYGGAALDIFTPEGAARLGGGVFSATDKG